MGIVSADRVPPDQQQFQKHSDSVRRHVYFRSGIMRPANGNLRDPEPIPFGEKEDLRVETKTFHALPLKNNPRVIHAKGLESALGVGKFNAHDPSHQAVEENSRLLANHGLVDFDETSVQRAGADGAVISLFSQGCEQLISFLDWRG